MTYAPPMDAEDSHAATLRRLAALTLELAENLQARALAAESGAEAATLANAFHKVSRGLRQTLALDLRLIRFRRDLAREAPDYEARQRRAREEAERDLDARDDQALKVRGHVEPAILFTEREYEEGVALTRRFRSWLDLARERPDFLVTDALDLAEKACRVLGLDPALMAGDEDGDDEDPDAPLLPTALNRRPTDSS